MDQINGGTSVDLLTGKLDEGSEYGALFLWEW